MAASDLCRGSAPQSGECPILNVGLTHIRGGGTGTDTTTGATLPLAFQADMGFSQGKYIGTDGRQHQGTVRLCLT